MSFDGFGSPQRGGRGALVGTPGTSYQSSYQSGGSDTWGGGAGSGGGTTNASGDFQRVSQDISRGIKEINQNVAQITRMGQSVGVKSRDSHEMRVDLRHMVEETGRLCKATSKDVKSLGHLVGGNTSHRATVNRLNSNFKQALEAFSDAARVVKEREAAHPPPAPAGAGSTAGSLGRGGAGMFGEGVPYDDEEGGRGGYAAPVMGQKQREEMMARDDEIEFNEAILRERDEGVREIEKAMHDVHDIFVEMANIVEEQAPMIDNIESHIDSAVGATSKGVYELRQAESYQKSARTKICIIAIILLVVVCIVIVLLILGVTLGLKWSDIKDKF